MTQSLEKVEKKELVVPKNEMEQLQLLIDSKALPSNIKTIEQAFTIAQYGKELGLKVMQSFHQIYSIQGISSLKRKNT